MATKEYWCFSRNTRTYTAFAYRHREERKHFSALKSERKTLCLEPRLQRWRQCVSHPSLGSAAQPVLLTLIAASPAAPFSAWEDDGFMMQMKVDRKLLHQSPDHLHHFFSSETWGFLDGKCVHFFYGCSV